MTDRSGPSRGANKNTSILGANNISPRYIPPKTTIPLYTLNILDNHLLDVPDARERYGVSGDVLRRLVFFIFVVRIMRYPGTTKWNGRARRSRKASAHFYCIRRMHRYLCARLHPQQGRASSLCLDLVAVEVSSISLRNSLINANSY